MAEEEGPLAGMQIVIDGVVYDETARDDMTFEEQRELRSLVRELMGDPHAETGDASLIDLLPALATVIRRRTDPDFAVATALKLKWSEIVQPEKKANGRPPTKAKATRSTAAATGVPKTSSTST